jgi:hypothetical protein
VYVSLSSLTTSLQSEYVSLSSLTTSLQSEYVSLSRLTSPGLNLKDVSLSMDFLASTQSVSLERLTYVV